MCTEILVCHGDRASLKNNIYKKKQLAMVPKDAKPATYYITNDGKYAIDADFISAADMNDPEFDVKSVPRVRLSR